jgi:nitroreductase
MHDCLETLLAAAVQAPSGDNTQPWRFAVDRLAGRITLLLDPARDPSPMNAGQRMARIALGAALENMLHTAGHYGWSVTVEPAAPPAYAVLHVTAGGEDRETPAAVVARVTNRRPYDGRPVAAETLAKLRQQTPPLEGVVTHWITGPERLAGLAGLVGRADALMFGEVSMRRAFLANVRFDVPAATPVEEGLPLAALELSALDRLGLRTLGRLPSAVLKWTGALGAFAAKARQLVRSASGLCLFAAPDRQAGTDFLVGRAVQRAWLALAAHGLAAQPMMSWPVLENVTEHGTPDAIAALGRDRLAMLFQEFRAALPELGAGRPAFLLRFGSSCGSGSPRRRAGVPAAGRWTP